jgi:hypothetical protein
MEAEKSSALTVSGKNSRRRRALRHLFLVPIGVALG